jgi:hypothetical protein
MHVQDLFNTSIPINRDSKLRSRSMFSGVGSSGPETRSWELCSFSAAVSVLEEDSNPVWLRPALAACSSLC